MPDFFVVDARPGRRPPTRRPPVSGQYGVLLMSRSCDADLDGVQDLLAKAGVRTVRLNCDELASVDLLADPQNRAVYVNGEWLSPTVTWVRHFSGQAVDGTSSAADDLFLRESWQAVARQLTAISAEAIPQRQPGILAQLLLARQHGVTVPRTVLTTDPGRAGTALDCPRLVIKAVGPHFVEASPGMLSGIFPVVTDGRALCGYPTAGPPVIVQEYIEHDAELRVYFVAGQVLCFEVGKESAADPWAAPERVTVRRVAAPAAVTTATASLASAMSLDYGAFDFLIQAGVPVFLEVNADGDWRWAEHKAGVNSVTRTVARMLSDRHHRAVGPGGVPFDLLTFLGPNPPC